MPWYLSYIISACRQLVSGNISTWLVFPSLCTPYTVELLEVEWGYLCSTDAYVTLALPHTTHRRLTDLRGENVVLGNWRNLPSHRAYSIDVHLTVTCWCNPMWSYNYGFCWRYWEPTQDLFAIVVFLGILWWFHTAFSFAAKYHQICSYLSRYVHCPLYIWEACIIESEIDR